MLTQRPLEVWRNTGSCTPGLVSAPRSRVAGIHCVQQPSLQVTCSKTKSLTISTSASPGLQSPGTSSHVALHPQPDSEHHQATFPARAAALLRGTQFQENGLPQGLPFGGSGPSARPLQARREEEKTHTNHMACRVAPRAREPGLG
ncbi:Hypothetical predicted protein [Marmota monax]|uniref:Uncharacterized protein n=1 Tax=Marmota monax TaxID=9995 RepID=A0A5E4CLP7_MARMO|nr:hypothetical protein GHT09_011371 [Marmota monax]VTJ82745.1 Hypothetical predicted protein [Marmota monax]